MFEKQVYKYELNYRSRIQLLSSEFDKKKIVENFDRENTIWHVQFILFFGNKWKKNIDITNIEIKISNILNLNYILKHQNSN